MRQCIGLLCLSALMIGCGADGAAPSTAVVEKYPWDGASWSTDIVIDGPAEDQQAVRSFIYYLKRNVGDGSLGPFGNTNEKYKGRVFWDADVWVFPALALVDPERARAITDFRLRTAAMAESETDASLSTHLQSFKTVGPVQYPWESDGNGHDVAEGPTRKEIHVGGDVMWGLEMASTLGLAKREAVDQVGKGVASFFVNRSEPGPFVRQLRGVTGVDEWFEGDNCLYTNAIAEWTVRRYLDLGPPFFLPRNQEGELVAYEGDQEQAYQQAAAPLILWPLEREDLVDDPIAFLDRFEGKEAPSGPAMSLSVYALIRARYGDADVALDTWRESWKKYTDGNPMLMFSEKPGRKDLTYFNTGAAGCLNAVIYGFIGARIVDDATKDNAKVELLNGRWLVFRPNLPSAWKKVTFKGMQVLGKSYTVVCEGRRATISDE